MKKKFLTLTLAFVLVFMSLIAGGQIFEVNATERVFSNNCRAYVLMDKDSGSVLVEEKATEQMPVASIVKLMTILLTLEEIDAGNLSIDDKVAVSGNASGMGGSQIFLDANTEYEVGNLLKSVIVCSANDSSVALAEHIAGSEELFVEKMNKRAKELKMDNTNYENATGLPSPNQYSCAIDVAKVLTEVLDYELYHEYSKIWLEDFVHPSGRTTEMTNTNKLIRFYDGCIGGKTGSTNEAKYCLGAGATRNGMTLVSVVLGSENSKERFDNVRELFNYGFANYSNNPLFSNENLKDTKIKMQGQDKFATIECVRNSSIVTKKGEKVQVEYNYNLPSSLVSVEKGETIGYVEIIVDGKLYDTIDLISTETINEPSYLDYIKRIEEDFV